MSIEILDCLKRQRDICVKNVIPSQNTAFMFAPALNNHIEKTNKQSAVRATTAQLYPDRDTFEFDQEHVTKNQPITELILSSESLAI